MTYEIHLECLLGKRVLDVDGQSVGRIEEIRAEQDGGDYYVQEYLLGPYALLERVSLWVTGLSWLRRLHTGPSNPAYRIPWDQLDLSDPEQPRLRCTKGELQERMGSLRPTDDDRREGKYHSAT
jgi:sporulation protein YlmC with PRC-barrel domain